MTIETAGGKRIEIRQGDLTEEEVDAIVNAANSHLAHGGGVAGAIVRKGGKTIQEESDAYVREHGPVPTGKVAVTGAGNLPSSYVIHAVGPVWKGGDAHEDALLESAVWESLLAAHERKLRSIAIPAISSGIFGFPKARCAAILLDTARKFCERFPESPLEVIRFTNIDRETCDLLVAEASR
ncbi:MAG: macro domain-containing protein [Deltaproteobacteria bacterium]|nr:MAG: macro domain-containing protein [Deltaproteobacteria bacterium]